MVTQNIQIVSPEAVDDSVSVLGALLSYVMLLVGVATLCSSLFVTIRSYSPVWYQDQWSIGLYLTANGGHYPLHVLWEQHNEHRIPIQKLLCLIDLYLFKGRNVFLYVASWTAQLAQLGLSIFVIRRFGLFSANQVRSLIGLIMFCEFNPNQLENFTWGFQSAFFLSFVFSGLSLASLILYSRVKRVRPGRSRIFLAVAIISAFLSECSLAGGLVIWVILPLCGWMLRLSRRVVAGLLISGLAGVSIYLIGYRTPGYHTSPVEALKQPFTMMNYIQTYFASSWDSLGRNFGSVLTAFAICFVVATFARMLLKDKREESLTIFSACMAMISLLTAFMTALGRLKFGIAQATSSRYQTPAMVFWCFTAIALLSVLVKVDYKRFGFLLIQIAAISLFVFQAIGYPATLEIYQNLAFRKDVAGLALEADTDPASTKMLFPDIPGLNIIDWFRFLRARNILPPPFDEFQYVGFPLKAVFDVAPPGSCLGYMDYVGAVSGEPPNNLKALGWSSIHSFISGRAKIIITTEDNKIVGIGITGSQRPDVTGLGLLPTNELDSGWQGYAIVNGSSQKIRAYEELPDGKVCILNGEIAIPRQPVAK